MVVLQVCAYGAEYPGNFIASLETLESALKQKGIDTIYAFVEKARDRRWCKDIQRRSKVYFLPEAKARVLPKTYKLFRRIYSENDISIVHSHFELYDIPTTVTAPKGIKVFWHLHDPIEIGRGLRQLIWKIQYGFVSRKANLISVADYYRKAVVELGFPAEQTTTVVNGINLARIRDCRSDCNIRYDFLTFGWDFLRKGDDVILEACKRLEKEWYSFKLLLNGNDVTWSKVKEYMKGEIPKWLVFGEPVDDVNLLFSQSRVFIQASRRETFSYAVCEAVYAGLPVISSDIPGLEWAHDLSSITFFENESIDQLYLLMRRSLDSELLSEEELNLNHSRDVICQKYSLDAWSERIIKQYCL